MVLCKIGIEQNGVELHSACTLLRHSLYANAKTKSVHKNHPHSGFELAAPPLCSGAPPDSNDIDSETEMH